MDSTARRLSVVGKRLPHLDASERATGRVKYIGDISLLGMLVGKVLRSPHPHARIVKIDTSAARNLPGVKAVITKDDAPAKQFNICAFSILKSPALAHDPDDQYIFCDKARFIGDPIAAVAAVDENTAEMALKRIKVEYEILPGVFDPIRATQAGAPEIHPVEKNTAAHVRFDYGMGNVAKGFAEADYIIEDTFYASRQKHSQLELTTSIACFDTTGRLTIWSICQIMHSAKRKIAELFDMPEGMIRWITPYIGGGFGRGLSLTNEPIVVLLAKKTGCPVKIEDSREEDFTARETRETFIQTGKLGIKQDGPITAVETKLITDTGGYFGQASSTTFVNMRQFLGLYRSPNTSAEADIVYTNNLPSGGMRSYGNPSATFALEQLIDMAAEKIGMDPVEFRLINIKKSGEPSPTPSIPIDKSALDECLRIGSEMINWTEKRANKPYHKPWRTGLGVACTTQSSGTTPALLEHSNAVIKFNPDGSINLTVSPCEMGQGGITVLAQIAAEELGLTIKNVHVVTGDTDVTLFDVGTHASRTAYVIGNAVLAAAGQARKQLLESASKLLSAVPEELYARDDYIYHKTLPEKKVTIAEVMKKAIYNFAEEPLNILGHCSFNPSQSRPFQATFIELEVDEETGQVQVKRVVMVADCGRIINPMNAEGQFEGGIMQGIGYALIEDYAIDKITGVVLADSFANYKLPPTVMVPEIQVKFLEYPNSSGPFGARGLGELPIPTIAPAIANAIYDAVGVRIKELPITPERIIKALHVKQSLNGCEL